MTLSYHESRGGRTVKLQDGYFFLDKGSFPLSCCLLIAFIIWFLAVCSHALSCWCCHVDYKAAPPKYEVILDDRIYMFIPSYFIIWCLWQPQRLTGGDSFDDLPAMVNIRRSDGYMTYMMECDWHDFESTSWYLGWNVELVSAEVSMATTLISQNASSLLSKGVRESACWYLYWIYRRSFFQKLRAEYQPQVEMLQLLKAADLSGKFLNLIIEHVENF